MGKSSTIVRSGDNTYNSMLLQTMNSQKKMAKEQYDFYQQGIGTYEKVDTGKYTWYKVGDQWTKRKKYDNVFTPDEGSVGYQTLEQDTIRAGIEMLPYETGLEKAMIEEQQALMTARAPIRDALFEKAGDTDASKAQGRAEADVQHAYSGIQADMDDKAFRAGVDPLSGRYIDATRQAQLGKAKDVATARTVAADTFNNQQTALQIGIAGIPAG